MIMFVDFFPCNYLISEKKLLQAIDDNEFELFLTTANINEYPATVEQS